MSRPTLSIVIASYRREQTIERSLQSFTSQGYPAEIVVVDSSPDERTADIVRRFPSVRLIRSETRVLAHAARNIGARASSSELLLFSDPDIYADEGAVETLVRAWQRHGGAIVAAVASHGTGWLERGFHLTKFDLWLPGSEERTLEVGPTCGFLCSREAFDRVGGFRGEVLLADAVFSWELRRAGFPIRLEPRAVVRHDHTQGWLDFVRERFVRGRAFAGLRGKDGAPARGKAYDLAATLSLLRPARVTWRAASKAREAGLERDAVVTLPVYASGTFAWFAGEAAGMLTTGGELR